MSKTLIVNHNLLGDSLILNPAIREYKKEHPDEQLIFLLGPEQYNPIHENNPNVSQIMYSKSQEEIAAIKEKYKFAKGKMTELSNGMKVYVADISRAFAWCRMHPKIGSSKSGKAKVILPHLCEGIADQLEVKLENNYYDITLTQEEVDKGIEYLDSKYPGKPVIICASLSRSCTSRSDKPEEQGWPANKMLSARVWKEVIKKLEDKYHFVFVASPTEDLLEIDAPWEVGLDIRLVASMCKNADLVISIDTGIAHVTAGVDGNLLAVAAAVPASLTIPVTRGKRYIVDHSTDSDDDVPKGIGMVKSEEIIEGIQNILGT